MTYEELISLMKEYRYVLDEKVKKIEWKTEGLSLERVKYYFIDNGTVYLEDKGKQIYVGNIRCGLLGKGNAITAIHLDTEAGVLKMAVFVREGILDFHKDKGVIDGAKKYFEKYIRKA